MDQLWLTVSAFNECTGCAIKRTEMQMLTYRWRVRRRSDDVTMTSHIAVTFAHGVNFCRFFCVKSLWTLDLGTRNNRLHFGSDVGRI